MVNIFRHSTSGKLIDGERYHKRVVLFYNCFVTLITINCLKDIRGKRRKKKRGCKSPTTHKIN